MQDLTNLEAFIFNSSTHWFAIRKIDNVWFNLNSTNSFPGPQVISDFYLSAFIKGTEELGYTNFLVKNLPQLPAINSETYKNLQPYQKLVSIADIVKHKPKKINMGDSDETQLEKALELSKKEFSKFLLMSDKTHQNTNVGNNDFDFYAPPEGKI
jgi:ataxin-3